MGYAHFGYILFGNKNSDFRNFKESMFALIRIILGDFEILKLENTNRIMGPIFIVLFVIFIFFVILNVLFAFINQTYTVVRSNRNLVENEYWRHVKNLGQKLAFRMGIRKFVQSKDKKNEKFIDTDYDSNSNFKIDDLKEEINVDKWTIDFENSIKKLDNRIPDIEKSINNIKKQVDQLINIFEIKQPINPLINMQK